MRALGFVAIFAVLCAQHAHAEELVLEDKGHRLRGGASFGVGTAVGWGGLAMRGEGRIGYQLTRTLGVFGLVAGGGSALGVWGGQFDLGVVAELVPVDWLYCGAGLVASYGHVQLSTLTGEVFSDPSGLSVRPALDLRVGLATGRSVPPFFNRSGLSVGLHALLMLHPAMSATAEPGFGGAPVFRAVRLIFTPMLTVGFDFR